MTAVERKSILIVDDTPENLRLLTRMLSEQRYRVRSAPSGEHALSSVRKELPDLILLDILMPEMDGFEVCRALKADNALKSIPVIFISALSEVFDKVAAFSSGAVDYITKPFQIEEVLARVETHLNMADLRQQLQTQNKQLHDQNRELQAFAHTVAHDLKNPLSTLLGTLELVWDSSECLDTQSRDLLKLGMGSGQRMTNIIDELLLLATVRKEMVQAVPINMRKVVESAMYRLSVMLERADAEVILPDTWPQALGYGPWIEEVWVNYISNAVKYGGEPPRIELGAALQGNGLMRFWLLDNGRGLDADAQAKLFTEFTRLDQVRAEGHGLGLSIVRRILEKLDGEFGVESAPGQGSLFYFALPVE